MKSPLESLDALAYVGPMRYLLLISLLLATPLLAPAEADTIYQTIGPDGSIVFSDQPSKGAKEIKIKPLTTYSAEEAKRKTSPAAASDNPEPETDTVGKYTAFSIVSPADDSTLPTGAAGNVTIRTQVKPALRVKNGHRLSVLLDGTQLDYTTSSASISLNNLDRGTHSIRAVIVNQRGDIVQLSSNSVTLHIKRASVFAPANPLNPRINRPAPNASP